ncbi:MAG: radical SAM protein [Bryobacteraceae bacterium]|nr:radical SAM protein [Bryobacteraceae bacterium]
MQYRRPFRLKRKALSIRRFWREMGLVAKGLWSTDHVVQAHIIPIRRCNLDCGYCNEYDDFSPPVPLEEMKRRISHLHRLGATLITISGGEPLLHPDLDEIIRHIRSGGAIAGMITNGYLLVPERIKRLNEAGLDHLQISIDNLMPDEVSKKSLKTLDKKLQMLAEHADFHVNINSVIGAGVRNQEDAYVIARRAIDYGLSSTVGIIHDGHGQLKPLSPEVKNIFDRIRKLGKKSYARLNQFQEAIAEGRENHWRCRAGARYLYVCEEGLVHYCSQQRGYPGRPIAEYTIEDVRREYLTEKSCAPACTISCVHQTSMMDFWRDPQTIPAPEMEREPVLVQIQTAGK